MSCCEGEGDHAAAVEVGQGGALQRNAGGDGSRGEVEVEHFLQLGRREDGNVEVGDRVYDVKNFGVALKEEGSAPITVDDEAVGIVEKVGTVGWRGG